MSIRMGHLNGALELRVGTLFGRERILITATRMQVQTLFLGFQIAQKTFETELVRHMKYEEWSERGVRACGIRFKYDGATHVLIRANESETLRTVVRIINVYKFSHAAPAEPTRIAESA